MVILSVNPHNFLLELYEDKLDNSISSLSNTNKMRNFDHSVPHWWSSLTSTSFPGYWCDKGRVKMLWHDILDHIFTHPPPPPRHSPAKEFPISGEEHFGIKCFKYWINIHIKNCICFPADGL